MEETVIENFDDVKFIQGMTKLNQTNWQAYFGSMIPTGVFKGLLVQNKVGSETSIIPRYLTDGIVYVNGIMAELKTEEGFTDISTAYEQNANDRFICIRVWLKEEKAQIVQKCGIAETAETKAERLQNVSKTIDHFIDVEDYCCDRNEFYWDVPIFYSSTESDDGQQESAGAFGISLRREVNLDRRMLFNPNSTGIMDLSPYTRVISGRNIYTLSNAETARIFMDNIDHAQGSLIRIEGRTSDSTVVQLSEIPWVNGLANTTNKIYTYNWYKCMFEFSDPTQWTHNDSYDYYQMTLDPEETIKIRFTLCNLFSPHLGDWDHYYPYYFVEVL